MVKDQYKSSFRTKNSIQNAFISMIMEDENINVSILDLCKKTNISRTTFYNHFSSIDELSNYTLDNIFNELDSSIKFNGYDEDEYLDSLLFDLTVYFKNSSNKLFALTKITKNIFFDKLSKLVNEKMLYWLKNFHPDLIDSIDLLFAIESCSYSISGLYFDYFSNNLKCSLLDINNYCKSIYKPLFKVKKQRQKKSLF